eukprot:6987931-Pyramimonas_sp.AAC.1
MYLCWRHFASSWDPKNTSLKHVKDDSERKETFDRSSYYLVPSTACQLSCVAVKLGSVAVDCPFRG